MHKSSAAGLRRMVMRDAMKNSVALAVECAAVIGSVLDSPACEYLDSKGWGNPRSVKHRAKALKSFEESFSAIKKSPFFVSSNKESFSRMSSALSKLPAVGWKKKGIPDAHALLYRPYILSYLDQDRMAKILKSAHLDDRGDPDCLSVSYLEVERLGVVECRSGILLRHHFIDRAFERLIPQGEVTSLEKGVSLLKKILLEAMPYIGLNLYGFFSLHRFDVRGTMEVHQGRYDRMGKDFDLSFAFPTFSLSGKPALVLFRSHQHSGAIVFDTVIGGEDGLSSKRLQLHSRLTKWWEETKSSWSLVSLDSVVDLANSFLSYNFYEEMGAGRFFAPERSSINLAAFASKNYIKEPLDGGANLHGEIHTLLIRKFQTEFSGFDYFETISHSDLSQILGVDTPEGTIKALSGGVNFFERFVNFQADSFNGERRSSSYFFKVLRDYFDIQKEFSSIFDEHIAKRNSESVDV